MRVAVEGAAEGWLAGVPLAELIERARDGALLVGLTDGATPDALLDAARGAGHGHALQPRAPDAHRPVPPRGGLVRRTAVRLVARRELTERVRERSFLVSTGVSIAIIALVVVLPPLLGFDGPDTFTVGSVGDRAAEIAQAARQGAGAFEAEVHVRELAPGDADAALRAGDVDVVLTGDGLRSVQKPDEKLVNLLQAADRETRAAAALREAGVQSGEVRRALAPTRCA